MEEKTPLPKKRVLPRSGKRISFEEAIEKLRQRPLNLRPRDPDRIKPLLELVEIVWRRFPDLRLGQLIENARSSSESTTTFHMEDQVLADGLRKLLEGAD